MASRRRAGPGPDGAVPAGKMTPFEIDFSAIPLWLREGPYTWTAILYLAAVTAAVVVWAPLDEEWAGWIDLASFPPPAAAPLLPHPALVSLVCGLYMVGVLGWMVSSIGIWPIVS